MMYKDDTFWKGVTFGLNISFFYSSNQTFNYSDMDKPSKSSQIRINIGLNESNVPVAIEWDADDSANKDKPQHCKALLLSLFDRETLDTIKIDLWTNEMQVNEMDRFFFQTLRALADTYFKATQNNVMATDMQKFVQYFGEKTGVLKSEK